MKIAFLFAAFLTTSSAALADTACWDGTFGYNYARTVEGEQGLEISFTGHSLQLPPLAPTSRMSLGFGDFSAARPLLHLVIPKSVVKKENGVITAKVLGTSLDTFEGRTPSLWVEYHVRDLGESRLVLTPIPLLAFDVTVSPESVNLGFTQMWSYDEEGQHLKSAIGFACVHGTAPETLKVPSRLKSFLN